MLWVAKKIHEIGMQRMLQDIIDELGTEIKPDDFIGTLIRDLETTLTNYKGRYDI